MTQQLIAIGASAGGVQALSHILPPLAADFPRSIVVVVHVPPRQDNALVKLFSEKCRMQVKEAEDKEPLQPGTIYFAPPDYHVLVEGDGALALSTEEPVNHSRPAIDVLFETAADAFGPAVTGIVLTGANHDGANGARAIEDAGGVVLIQDPATAEMAAMPEAAVEACRDAAIMTLDEIAASLAAGVAE
ncbi:chemotaxis protein CheB [Croceicoccus naphthovorans]|uniref:protein-glutamate methylesterase n=1 Tax=Croceicoccus naphthovorans TaxID=1348774 RepID=A0A0G3XD01_9SPHN|nr:chemotaxis protein CheB [Croceicoccus naphthovorans]AKM09440.1 chemotaxis protein CheB [Croceicoccus naphthovorans]MBB3991951.1 two-component system chemotaxis response regulator CheB [Croceicoccus naphthovorans]